MPYVDIGTYTGFIPEEKKVEIAQKVRALLSQELGRPESTFTITATGVPPEDWGDYVATLRKEKEVILDVEKK